MEDRTNSLWHELCFLVGAVARSAFKCSHTRVRVAEGKAICPDCGDAVVVRWAQLRCTQCHTLRPGRYLLRTPIATDAFCGHCGATETALEMTETPPVYRLQKAFLMIQTEQEYLDSLYDTPKTDWKSKVKVWLDADPLPVRGFLAASA